MPSPFVSVGIDLAGSPRRPTGVCVLTGLGAATRVAGADDEIIAWVAASCPALVTIDAPLTLPPGRATIDDRNGEHFRECDRALQARGIRFFPITLGPMRMLTSRGIRLARALEARGFRVAEGYPGGAQDLWGIPRKQAGLPRLRRGLARFGVRGLSARMTNDELDAVTLALVGRFELLVRGEMWGGPRGILMPRVGRRRA